MLLHIIYYCCVKISAAHFIRGCRETSLKRQTLQHRKWLEFDCEESLCCGHIDRSVRFDAAGSNFQDRNIFKKTLSLERKKNVSCCFKCQILIKEPLPSVNHQSVCWWSVSATTTPDLISIVFVKSTVIDMTVFSQLHYDLLLMVAGENHLVHIKP